MQSASKSSPMNLPNAITMVRIGAAPVLVVLMLYTGRTISVISAVLFAVVCATDWLDGYLARKRGDVTTLGKFLDPLADKLLVTAALIMLIPSGRIPAWVVALMISREIAVTGLRAIASDAGVVISASILGKLKTVTQIASIIPLILHYTFYGLNFHSIGMVLLVVAFIFTIWSGVDYFLKFFRKYSLSSD